MTTTFSVGICWGFWQLPRYSPPNHLGRDALLFAMPAREPESDAAEADDTPPPDLTELGRTDPNRLGRTYPHGTVTAYNLGGCRYRHCRDACARYRAQRRADGKDDRRVGRRINTDGHIRRRWFAQYIWKPRGCCWARHQRSRSQPTPRPRLMAARRRRRQPPVRGDLGAGGSLLAAEQGRRRSSECTRQRRGGREAGGDRRSSPRCWSGSHRHLMVA